MKGEVDAYIAAAPSAAQPQLRMLRKIIRSAAPKAEETISYKMPHYRYQGHLVYFAAFKDHVSLYPAGYVDPRHGLARYAAGKGTYRFPLDQPLPVDLIRKFIRARLNENDAEVTRAGTGARRSQMTR